MADEQPGPPCAHHFEFRVWGLRARACRAIADLADGCAFEHVTDCYLLVDDPAWNVKIRRGTLKIKRFVGELDGFEQWEVDRQQRGATAHCRFDSVGPPSQDPGIHRVFVSKDRRIFRIGTLRAEATDLTVWRTDTVLHTVSIEGSDLDRLHLLRDQLGWRAEDNLAVHRALQDHRRVQS